MCALRHVLDNREIKIVTVSGNYDAEWDHLFDTTKGIGVLNHSASTRSIGAHVKVDLGRTFFASVTLRYYAKMLVIVLPHFGVREDTSSG